NARLREKGRDLEGFIRVVKGSDLEPELARDIEHDRHFIGAVAMVLDENFAAEHPGKGFKLEITLRRIAGFSARRPPVPPANIIGCVDPGPAVTCYIAHTCSR